MKVRAFAPALLAIVALGVVYVVARDRDEPAEDAKDAADAPAKAPAEHVHAPVGSGARVASPEPALAPEPMAPGEAPSGVPRVLTPEEYAGHEPVAKKPKMTLQEKLVETKKHIAVMERRAELLAAEIAELDRKGETQKAAEQRIVLKRLEAHADKLRQDVAEGREPQ